MVVLVAHAQCLPDRIQNMIEACAAARKLSVLEPGCEKYDFFQSPDDPCHVVFVEEWTSREDLEAHFQADSFVAFQHDVKDLLAQKPSIRIYSVSQFDDL